MQLNRTIIVACLLTQIATSVMAQSSETNSSNYPKLKFDGTLKNKYEYVDETGNSRFTVRNSRLGVSGNITPSAGYRAQVELSNEGQFQVLDLFGTLHPLENLSIRFGQTSVPIFNSYTTNPGTMLFANRTFLAKYLAGTRDIGVVGEYKFNPMQIPVGIELGVFNGDGINSAIWGNQLSYSGRLSVGTMDGWRTTFKVYNFREDTETRRIEYMMYGADLRYQTDRWKVEGEIMQRDELNSNRRLLTGYVQGAYGFPLQCKMFKNVVPALRWDAIDQINNDLVDVHRLTTGVAFGLSEKLFSSLLRIDYEWYFVNNTLAFMNAQNEMDASKFTVELVYIF